MALKSSVSRSAMASRRPIRIVAAQAAKPSSNSAMVAVAACSAAMAAALMLGVSPVEARVVDVSEKTAQKEAEFQVALSKIELLVEKQRAELKAAAPKTAPSPVAAAPSSAPGAVLAKLPAAQQ